MTRPTEFTGFKDLDDEDRESVGRMVDAIGKACFVELEKGTDPWLVHRAIAIHAGMNVSAAALTTLSPQRTVSDFLDAILLTANECKSSLQNTTKEELLEMLTSLKKKEAPHE